MLHEQRTYNNKEDKIELASSSTESFMFFLLQQTYGMANDKLWE